jgi:hypothetical protein
MTSLEYKSFLVRLWREKNGPSPQANWEAEIEHIQSGERRGFNTLDELLEFLRQQLAEVKSAGDSG